MIRIVFIGGAIRAVKMFEFLQTLPFVAIDYAIFMNGYEDEHKYADRLEAMAKAAGVEYVRADKVTAEIVKRTKAAEAKVILGGGTWRSLLGADFLGAAEYGYISMHGSGLPDYRGWCPINWQIINGEANLVSRMFQLNAGIDAGPLVVDENDRFFEVVIPLKDRYYGEAVEQLAVERLPVYERFLEALAEDRVRLVPQYEPAATFGCSRRPEDGEIDWSRPTAALYDFVRGLGSPAPGAFSFYDNKRFVVRRASVPHPQPVYKGRIAGKVVYRDGSGFVDVLTGDGILRLEELEVDGEAVRPADFLKSVRVTLGYRVRDDMASLRAQVADLRARLEAVEAGLG